MRLFMDTEFTDFMCMGLISIGIISECGNHEFYVEISDYNRKLQNTFVEQTIVPLLDMDKYGKTYEQAGADLLAWLESIDATHYEVTTNYVGDHYLMQELIGKHFHHLEIHYQFIGEEIKKQLRLESLYDTSDEWLSTSLANKQHRAATDSMLAEQEYFNQPGNTIHHALTDAKALRAGWLAAKTHFTRYEY